MSDKRSRSPSSDSKLRPADQKISRAELQHWVEKLAELVQNDPSKAATILTDWVSRPAKAKRRKAG